MGVRTFLPLGRGRIQRDAVPNSNIYAGMVTRNMTEPTYTTSTDGTSIALNPPARHKQGSLDQMGSMTFGARKPKGMLLRTSAGPVMVSTAPPDPQRGYTVGG
jgi:hypothetical protein